AELGMFNPMMIVPGTSAAVAGALLAMPGAVKKLLRCATRQGDTQHGLSLLFCLVHKCGARGAAAVAAARGWLTRLLVVARSQPRSLMGAVMVVNLMRDDAPQVVAAAVHSEPRALAASAKLLACREPWAERLGMLLLNDALRQEAWPARARTLESVARAVKAAPGALEGAVNALRSRLDRDTSPVPTISGRLFSPSRDAAQAAAAEVLAALAPALPPALLCSTPDLLSSLASLVGKMEAAARALDDITRLGGEEACAAVLRSAPELLSALSAAEAGGGDAGAAGLAARLRLRLEHQQRRAGQLQDKVCAVCGRDAGDGVKLRVYCSEACAKSAWRGGHKAECGQLRQARGQKGQ
ncbi:hypothetical protein MNEG_8780, partial [Monoraphidium neglectum]